MPSVNHASHDLRQLAIAFVIGSTIALAFDVVLQNAIEAVRSPGSAGLTPWWIVGRLFERAVPVVAGLLVWLLAPRLSRPLAAWWPGAAPLGRAAAYDLVGRALIVVPLVWVAATWIVLILDMTLEGDMRIFTSGAFYYNLLLRYAPWAAGGIALLVLRRHAAE